MKRKQLVNYDDYIKLLKNSLKENNAISEDSARYLFYYSVTKEHNASNKMLAKFNLELPYFDARMKIKDKSILKNNSELDAYFEIGKDKYAVEFKFHREISNKLKKKTIPHTKYAGEIFDDINRLSLIDKNINRYFIYLMDEGMINYKKNDKDNSIFQKIVLLEENERKIIKQIELKKNQPKTFIDELYSSFEKVVEKNLKLDPFIVKMEKSKFFDVKEKKYHLIVLKIINK